MKTFASKKLLLFFSLLRMHFFQKMIQKRPLNGRLLHLAARWAFLHPHQLLNYVLITSCVEKKFSNNYFAKWSAFSRQQWVRQTEPLNDCHNQQSRLLTERDDDSNSVILNCIIRIPWNPKRRGKWKAKFGEDKWIRTWNWPARVAPHVDGKIWIWQNLWIYRLMRATLHELDSVIK